MGYVEMIIRNKILIGGIFFLLSSFVEVVFSFISHTISNLCPKSIKADGKWFMSTTGKSF